MSRDMYWLRIDRYYSSKEKIEVKEGLDKGLTFLNFTIFLLNHLKSGCNLPTGNVSAL
jgi:hypothetical protein